MARIKFDEMANRLYTVGVKMGVLYPYSNKAYQTGVPYDGLTKVDLNGEGADASDKYADNIKYFSIRGAENIKGTIESYFYPPEWLPCIGRKKFANGATIAQQTHQPFGFCYRTEIGNAEEGIDAGYMLRLVYNATAGAASYPSSTLEDNTDPEAISFEFDTVPTSFVLTENGKEVTYTTSVVEIDSRDYATEDLKSRLSDLEDKLYGCADGDPTLPSIEDVFAILSGTYTD